MPYIFLSIAIIGEVIATSLLKLSDGFSRPVYAFAAIACYSISFYFLAITMKAIPIGVVYAIWAGVGIALIALIGYFAFGQKLNMAEVFGIALIGAGVLLIQVFGQSQH